jgi:UDP-galactopyranose mutase
VYDCADGEAEGASGTAERVLLRRADVVFTAGQDGFLARFGKHPCVRFVESGVDFDHFHGGARGDPPADLERIPAPRIGFAGVLNARVDFDLLRRLAAERPRLSFVLLGPVDGIAAARLPHAPNLYHPGPRPYERRPAYLGGFAAGVLPYRTDGRHAGFSPPEVLEFLAAGRPVVSTPLPEVVRRYPDVVTVAEADRFAEALDGAVAADADAAERGLERARSASWPRLVGEMEILVARAVQQRSRTPRLPAIVAASRAV